jgi:hypothetical protein
VTVVVLPLPCKPNGRDDCNKSKGKSDSREAGLTNKHNDIALLFLGNIWLRSWVHHIAHLIKDGLYMKQRDKLKVKKKNIQRERGGEERERERIWK